MGKNKMLNVRDISEIVTEKDDVCNKELAQFETQMHSRPGYLSSEGVALKEDTKRVIYYANQSMERMMKY